MVINGSTLLANAPIKDMLETKERFGVTSHGLAEVGYDIRIKQNIWFSGHCVDRPHLIVDGQHRYGHFTLASAIEEFDMPDCLTGVVHDKSTWARHGLGVFNTVIEPGWKGFLTLELVYHGQMPLLIEAGQGIAQVIFHQALHRAKYNGKYQNQDDRPVAAIAG